MIENLHAAAEFVEKTHGTSQEYNVYTFLLYDAGTSTPWPHKIVAKSAAQAWILVGYQTSLLNQAVVRIDLVKTE